MMSSTALIRTRVNQSGTTAQGLTAVHIMMYCVIAAYFRVRIELACTEKEKLRHQQDKSSDFEQKTPFGDRKYSNSLP